MNRGTNKKQKPTTLKLLYKQPVNHTSSDPEHTSPEPARVRLRTKVSSWKSIQPHHHHSLVHVCTKVRTGRASWSWRTWRKHKSVKLFLLFITRCFQFSASAYWKGGSVQRQQVRTKTCSVCYSNPFSSFLQNVDLFIYVYVQDKDRWAQPEERGRFEGCECPCSQAPVRPRCSQSGESSGTAFMTSSLWHAS